MIGTFKNGNEEVQEEFKSRKISLLKPVLSNFQMLELILSAEIYCLFRFDPMKNLSLGLLKMKTFCVSMLKDDTRTSDEMRTFSRVLRTFKAIQIYVLRRLNELFKDVETNSRRYGVHVDDIKGKEKEETYFVCEDVITGILDAADYDAMDMTSPFVGALLDKCYRAVAYAHITRGFKKYVNFTEFLYRHRIVAETKKNCRRFT